MFFYEQFLSLFVLKEDSIVNNNKLLTHQKQNKCPNPHFSIYKSLFLQCCKTCSKYLSFCNLRVSEAHANSCQGPKKLHPKLFYCGAQTQNNCRFYSIISFLPRVSQTISSLHFKTTTVVTAPKWASKSQLVYILETRSLLEKIAQETSRQHYTVRGALIF